MREKETGAVYLLTSTLRGEVNIDFIVNLRPADKTIMINKIQNTK